MTETKNPGEKLSVSPTKTLSLKRGVEQGVVRQSFSLVAAGVALGIFASVGLTRLLGAMLYGVQATDVLTYAGVVGLLAVAASLASYIPARRAMRVDPMVALRYE